MSILESILLAAFLILLGFYLGVLLCIKLEEHAFRDLDQKTWERIEGWRK